MAMAVKLHGRVAELRAVLAAQHPEGQLGAAHHGRQHVAVRWQTPWRQAGRRGRRLAAPLAPHLLGAQACHAAVAEAHLELRAPELHQEAMIPALLGRLNTRKRAETEAMKAISMVLWAF